VINTSDETFLVSFVLDFYEWLADELEANQVARLPEQSEHSVMLDRIGEYVFIQLAREYRSRQ